VHKSQLSQTCSGPQQKVDNIQVSVKQELPLQDKTDKSATVGPLNEKKQKLDTVTSDPLSLPNESVHSLNARPSPSEKPENTRISNSSANNLIHQSHRRKPSIFSKQFVPVDFNWQLQHSNSLQLPVKHALSLHASQHSISIGEPTRVQRIIGDGNCFFRSLSYVLTGNENHYHQVRTKIVQHMLLNTDYMERVLERRTSVLSYLQQSKIAFDRQWATENEIFAAAHMLQTDIYIFGQYQQNRPWTWHNHSATLHQPGMHISERNIYLKNANRNHYEVVLGTTSTQQTRHIEPSTQLEETLLKELNNQLNLAERKAHSDSNEKHVDRKTYKATWMAQDNTQNKNDYMRKYMASKRLQPKVRKTEQTVKRLKRTATEQEKQHKAEKRKQPGQLEKESISKRKKMQDSKQLEKERLRKQQTRTNPEQLEKENISKRKKRQDSKQLEKERLRKQQTRTNPEQLEKENISKRKKMQDSKQLEKERLSKQQTRTNPEQLEKEKLAKRKKRQDPEQLVKEKLDQREKRRQDSEQLQMETEQKASVTTEEMIHNFHQTVQEGPIYICTCCDQLWYRHSVRLAQSLTSIKEDLIQKCITGIISAQGKEWLCLTCYSAMVKNKLPSLAKANKMAFPLKPPELDLTSLEERLVAPRIPFMQLHQLPKGGQLSIHGNVVNVPTNVSTTVKILPRKQDEAAFIPIKLKRRLSYQHHYIYQAVRPHKVQEALKYLVHNSDLYKEEGIIVDEDWTYEDTSDVESAKPMESPNHIVDKSHDDKAKDNVEPETGDNPVVNPDVYDASTDKVEAKDNVEEPETGDNPNVNPDVWDERTIDDMPAGNLDTLLMPQDVSDEARHIISIAPGEGNRPLSIFMDKHSEILAFPTLFCGQARAENDEREVKVHYSEICKSELRRSDRRVAGHIPNLFFKLKKLQTQHILGKASLCLRKTRKKDQNFTAGMLKSSENIKKIVNIDEGYRIFKDLRGSPPYWEKVKRDIFAMIRQLGIPTWFTSFSSAETRWVHVLQILGQTVDKKVYSDEEVQTFSWFKKQELISKDPVTCARHFDFQVKKFIHGVLKHTTDPIGKVKDFFYKVEFQMRGSPHIHMLVWIENAPALEENNTEEIASFIDQYISCARVQEAQELVDRQQHCHSRTCQKKSKNVCRFNFPQPPLRKTIILEPLLDDTPAEKKAELKKKWVEVQKYLDGIKPHQTIPFDEFLRTCNLTEEEYLLVIQSSIKTKTVFLKREVNASRINNYNLTLLKAWRANMDIQFILDPYACAMYIVSYIAKSQRGMSNLMFNATKEAREGNNELRRQVQIIGNEFLNNVEVSGQETVYNVLQIPMFMFSRDVIFINTGIKEQRTVIVKTLQQLEMLPDDSTDIEVEGLLKHYADRPRQLQQICLADFVSWYKRVKQSSGTPKATQYQDIPEEYGDEEDDDDAIHSDDQNTAEWKERYTLKNGYILKRRKHQTIIRYVVYHLEDDSENYYRVLLMLFEPWRTEDGIKGDCDSYEDQYVQVTISSTRLTSKMDEYNHHSEQLDAALLSIQKAEDSDLEDKWDTVAPNTQHAEREAQAEGTRPADVFPSLQPTDNSRLKADIGLDLGIAVSSFEERQVVINMMPEDQYLQTIRSLNTEQRDFFYHVVHWIKTKSEPLHVFLTGGAGVGKTVVIHAIYQTLLRFLNKGADVNPDDPKIVLGARTGGAAFLIGGNTLHHLFSIPVSQGYGKTGIAHDKLNTLRCKFKHVRLVIIDEVSLVGNQMFSFINDRLQKIMGCEEPFGGVSVLVVGDLYQLKPVFDGWIFHNLKTGYGPLATNLWVEHFQYFQLTQIMRQKEDGAFAEVLNRLRVGQQTKADIALLKTRLIDKDKFSPGYPMIVQHIYLQNDLVNGHNSIIFEHSEVSKKIQIHAWDIVVGDVSQEIKADIRSRIPKDCTKTMGLLSILQTGIGLRVEISTNVDVEDGICNGAAGKIMAVTSQPGANRPSHIWVMFDGEKVGRNLCHSSKHLYTNNISERWTPIAEVKRQFRVGKYKVAQVMRCQFPLRASCAKTAHRCQGETLETAVVDLQGYSFPHVHYVVLSRVRNLSNVYIRNLNESAIRVDKAVHQEMLRLSTDRRLQFCPTPLPKDEHTQLKVLFHNVRSLHKHHCDIVADMDSRSAHICVFAETNLWYKDIDETYSIPGFNLRRFDCVNNKTVRPVFGLAVYHRTPIDGVYHYCQPTAKGTYVEFVVIRVAHMPVLGNVSVVAIYSSPQASMVELKAAIDEINLQLDLHKCDATFIMGDFNIDIIKHKSSQMLKYLSKYRQIVSIPTTDYHSLLDHVYTDVPPNHIQAGVLESYFSDHKPVWVALV
jgi:hypothetical protein